MTALDIRHDKTTVTLTDGQTAWTLDRENVRRLIAQLIAHEAKLDDGTPPRVYHVPSVWARGLVAP